MNRRLNRVSHLLDHVTVADHLEELSELEVTPLTVRVPCNFWPPSILSSSSANGCQADIQ